MATPISTATRERAGCFSRALRNQKNVNEQSLIGTMADKDHLKQ
jgi:hypothetical protein